MNLCKIAGIFLVISSLSCTEAICGIEFIKVARYKDGGTECIKYKNDRQLCEICIDRREGRGTGKAYIGGHPDLLNSRAMTEKEIIKAIADIDEIMSSKEYKKYTARKISRDEMKAIIKSSDSHKKRELHKTMSYGSVEEFKNKLANLARKVDKTSP